MAFSGLPNIWKVCSFYCARLILLHIFRRVVCPWRQLVDIDFFRRIMANVRQLACSRVQSLIEF